MNYALIESGVVVNIIYLHPQNASEFPAIPMGDVPVAIGDTYSDGAFYRDGVKVLTATEQAVADVLAEIERALDE